MNCRSGMFCYKCQKQLPKPNHIAFNPNGDIDTLCDECHDDLERFFDKGVQVNVKPRPANKGHE